MRKYLVAVSLVLAGPAMAQSVPVESDAIMSDDLSRARGDHDPGARLALR